MKRMRWVALVRRRHDRGCDGVVEPTAGAQSGDEKPKATDVGITDDEIHIAVIADVDNPIVPNLFKASMDAVKGVGEVPEQQGWRRRSRRPQGRGRLLRLEAEPNATNNAEIQACKNDVAMVGTSAVSLASVDDMRNCTDSTGAVTGLPDIPFVSTALVHQCSDQSFPIAPPQVDCATEGRAPADVPGRTCRAATTTSRSTARRSSTASTCSATTRSRPVTPRSPASARCVTSASSPTRTSTSPGSRPSRRTRR